MARILAYCLGVTVFLVSAMPALAGGPQASLERRIVLSGHSLTDPIAAPLEALGIVAGAPRGRVERSTIPGSPLDWRWNNRPDGVDARAEIARFDVLVLTERVPLSNTMPWHNSPDEALRWARHAWEQGAGGRGAEVLLYASWVSLTPEREGAGSDPEGHLPWRERLDLEAPRWQAIVDHVNAGRPDGVPPMRLIPANRVMAAVHDAIIAGQVPGLEGIEALFSDDIHLSEVGAWLVALTHFAVIHRTDPRGLPGPMRPALPSETRDALAELAWQVVRREPAAGVGGH
ncbi:MAG: hypothetical protein ACK4LQ_13855 [Pararhodobacter sp.]